MGGRGEEGGGGRTVEDLGAGLPEGPKGGRLKASLHSVTKVCQPSGRADGKVFSDKDT